jgi:C4-dicarboxylate transporter DctQ subunit
MNLLTKIIDKCVLALAAISGIILLLLLIAVCFATVSRFLFNEPFSNLIDYATYSLVFVTFLGAPWLMSKRGHVNIDLLITLCPLKVQKYWNAVIDFVMVLISFAVAFIATELVHDYYINGRVMQDIMMPPQWIVLLPIPLGCFFLGLQSFLNGIEDIKLAREFDSSNGKDDTQISKKVHEMGGSDK